MPDCRSMATGKKDGDREAELAAAMVHLDIRPTPYDHPDAIELNKRLHLDYVRRYGYWDGDKDAEPLEPAMFTPPNGIYLVAYDDQHRPVAGGGWCAHDWNDKGYSEGDAEVKRMYVVPEARRLGLARRILSALEDSAWAAGRSRIILTTGTEQPEAIALYLSSGYTPHTRFGYYREFEDARFFAKVRRAGVRRRQSRLPAKRLGTRTLPKQRHAIALILQKLKRE